MTIPTSTDTRKEEVGNGVKVAFDFGFKIFANTDIKVFKYVTATGVQTEQTLGVDYTVAINGIDNSLTTPGGTVTYTVAPAATDTSLILGDYSFDQTQEYTTAGNFPEVTIEKGLDKLTLLVLQLQEKLNRALTQQESSSGGGITFPTAVTDRGIKFNASGDFVLTDNDPDEQVANATTQATNAATSATNAATSATNAATSETNAATSATSAAASATQSANNSGFSSPTENVAWDGASASTIIVRAGTRFRGVSSGNWYTISTDRTFDITTSGVAGGLYSGSEANSTIYYLLGIGDDSAPSSAHVLAVPEADYASFTTADLPSPYDDYKRIGFFFNNSSGSIDAGSYRDGQHFYDSQTGTISSVSSSTFTDVDLSAFIPPVVRTVQMRFQSSTTSTSNWRLKGGGSSQTLIASDQASIVAYMRLDENGVFQVNVSTGNISFQLFSYVDNLENEGQ